MIARPAKSYRAALTLLFGFFVVACQTSEPRVGGYTKALTNSKEVIAAATFAVEAQEIAIQEKTGEKAALELVDIQKAEQQVVAGMNYRLTLKVKLNNEEKTAEAIVWWQSWRQPDPYRLTSWIWK